jgi:formate-dependent nitrite reductase membrane component NrfD
MVQILPYVELSKPAQISKNVFKPTSLTKKLVHTGAVAMKIVMVLKTLFLLVDKK